MVLPYARPMGPAPHSKVQKGAVASTRYHCRVHDLYVFDREGYEHDRGVSTCEVRSRTKLELYGSGYLKGNVFIFFGCRISEMKFVWLANASPGSGFS